MKPYYIQRLNEAIYNFFLENYENENMAIEKSESITNQILELIENINIKFDNRYEENTANLINSL